MPSRLQTTFRGRVSFVALKGPEPLRQTRIYAFVVNGGIVIIQVKIHIENKWKIPYTVCLKNKQQQQKAKKQKQTNRQTKIKKIKCNTFP